MILTPLRWSYLPHRAHALGTMLTLAVQKSWGAPVIFIQKNDIMDIMDIEKKHDTSYPPFVVS